MPLLEKKVSLPLTTWLPLLSGPLLGMLKGALIPWRRDGTAKQRKTWVVVSFLIFSPFENSKKYFVYIFLQRV